MLILFVLLSISGGWAANWAQPSGEVEQNTAIPYIPAPNTPHWSARYGMTAITSHTSNLTAIEYVYILGGDSYDGDDTRRNYHPGLLDKDWENGYKNDVWRMTTIEWYVKGDEQLRTPHKQKIPRVYSKLVWHQVTQGIRPPLGMTNDDWISCETYFRNQLKPGVDCTDERAVQWSPRRNHAGIEFKGYIWIFGGRAREFVDLPEEKSIGGIIGPHVADIPRTEANALQQFSTQREVSVYKSDVWRSTDGEQWELVNPGCKVGQATLLADGNVHEGKKGTFSSKCNADIDCYGAETCDQTYKTCVCAIWSPREQHAVATDPENNFLYLSGGFASRLYSEHSDCGPYACGQTAASDYRYYLSDVWRSANGQEWTLITESAFGNIGRGGHSMLVFPFTYNGALSLWVIGGKTGDNTFSGGPEVFLNDIWTSPLTGSLPAPTQWTALAIQGSYHMPWSPRTGHTVAFEDKSLNIPNARTLYLYGGQTAEGVSGDLWAWRLDDPNDSWRKDFTPASLYTSGTGSELSYHNNSPAVNYLTPDSDLLALKRFWVPTKPSTTGSRYELRSYIPQADIEAMRSVGLNTIAELAAADLYTVLKLRGFDIPQVPLNQRYKVSAICDYRAFAKAIVDKCSLTVPSLYDGERQMPWNIVPVFGGKAPKRDPIAWHGRGSYDMLQPPVDDVDVRTAEWDGCLFDGVIQGLHGPDVSGVGYVTQVSSVRKPDPEVQNLFCRQGPGPRVFHSMVFFKEGLYLFGGKTNPGLFHADTWLRDAGLPSATIVSAPGDRTSANWFIFRANEAGCYFEYRLWDPINYKEIRGWTPVTFKTSVYWLNWRVGGPGNGQYTMYVRAVDPAGNRDDVFIKGINVVTWYYVSPTPWDIIFGIVGAFVGLCIIAYFEYRRRVKKAAMERYAMKRMRRKFKAMQRDVEGRAVDWRTLYMESKQAEDMGKREKKKLKKTRDKNAEKRDKEKKKREKEKELIKRKLKANKDFKAKSASSKAEESSKTKSSRKNQVVPSSLDAEGALAVVPEGDEEDGDIEAPPMVKGRSKARLMASSSKGASSKVAPGTEDDDGEEGKALADTETGFKSRKVNKRYKAYEAGTAPGGGDEEKDGDGPELFRKGSSKDNFEKQLRRFAASCYMYHFTAPPSQPAAALHGTGFIQSNVSQQAQACGQWA